MIDFEDVASRVHEQYLALRSQPRLAGALREYRLDGGGGAGRPWFVAGIYAYLDASHRLVLEVLHSPALDSCAVRLFCERTQEFQYSRKVVESLDNLPPRLQEAARLLELHLPEVPIPVERRDPPRVLPVSVRRVLLPVPPPVLFAELEE